MSHPATSSRCSRAAPPPWSTPIGVLKGKDFLDEQPTGELALSLREELTDIQYGRREDKHGWLVRLDG